MHACMCISGPAGDIHMHNIKKRIIQMDYITDHFACIKQSPIPSQSDIQIFNRINTKGKKVRGHTNGPCSHHRLLDVIAELKKLNCVHTHDVHVYI